MSYSQQIVTSLKCPKYFQSFENIDLENCQSAYITKGFNEVKNKGKYLVDYIDPENGLLHELVQHDIIDEEKKKSLEEITTYQILNERLISELIEK